MNYKKILIAIDDQPTAEYVAEQGLQLATQLNAQIALISVADTAAMTEGDITPDEMADMIKSDLKKSQDKIVHSVFNDNVVTFFEEGTPDERILKVAEDWKADLIVLGKHSGKGLSGVFAGSVTKKVTRHSKIPVMLIPPQQ